jgi:hypothetical protein
MDTCKTPLWWYGNVETCRSTDYTLLWYTGGAKKSVHILRDVIYVLLFEVELNYGSNV